MNRMFRRSAIALLLSAAALPLWLGSSAQQTSGGVQAAQDGQPLALKLSYSLSVEPGPLRLAGETLRWNTADEDRPLLGMEFILSRAHAADAGEPPDGKEAQAASQQAAERRNELLHTAELLGRQKLEQPGGDPFAALAPPPPPPVVQAPPPPPPPPAAPALPFTYLGRMMENGVTTVFLSRQDQGFSVRLNSVLDGNYRVDQIDGERVVFTYLPLNVQQTLSTGRPG